ncbi:flagellar motor protein MotD [Luteimonas viscosa]|uniref:Flagellar motor protein MotD n=1 Tax=Luteimonas viscosa TaxID=1132694 RepID=A0A5D4XNR9_9GAMM|nr:flagellar motor protein MotD [Luteimonas viscosa]TYT26327.1 flagellar motor protein MotD [Luteimonas viscosa]
MARRHQHEEHQNHEAWAVPYGDLVTLLLAFFVVMYAISSVNEGKYRAVSDALSSAFGGPPRSITPIQLGQTQLRGSSFDRPSLMTPGAKTGPTATSPVSNVRIRQMLDMPTGASGAGGRTPEEQRAAEAAAMDASLRGESQLNSLGRRIQHALAELVRQELVTVRRGRTFLEVEIQSDILFASGVAAPSPVATATVRKLGAVLRDEANAVRVEGYTDDLPISTATFPSNWELSAARAASVVHVLAGEGVDPGRLAVVGYGEHQPVADNATAEGRNANRRVLLVILAAPDGVDAIPSDGPEIAVDLPQAAPVDPAAVEAEAVLPAAVAASAVPASHAGAY